MKTLQVKGIDVVTNYGAVYPLRNDIERLNMIYQPRKWILPEGSQYRRLESEREMLERLVDAGYRKITFYRRTTSVRGAHEVYAYCK